jgi:uncharacterized MAPEG superfamily protein
VPLWALLGFAVWTVVLLITTVGVYRWSRILTGRVQIREFPGDQVEGEEWYKRAMRKHANCVENLPVFGALVLTLYASGIRSSQVALPQLASVTIRPPSDESYRSHLAFAPGAPIL